MKSKYNETSLRHLLKDHYDMYDHNGLDLLFVEAGKGGSVGLPDVFYPYENRLIPIELKHFVVTEKFELRPTQYPMHQQFAKSNTPAFCFVLVEYKNTDILDCDILMFASRNCLGLHGEIVEDIFSSSDCYRTNVFKNGMSCLHDLFDTEIAKCFVEAANRRSIEGLGK